MMMTKKTKFGRDRRSEISNRSGEGKSTLVGRVPQVAKLMALAIHIDQLIRNGVIKDQAGAARLGHVSRARMTQIMNLLNLAPDTQEGILFLAPVERGRDPVSERELRVFSGCLDWGVQRGLWAERMLAFNRG